jgi:phage terminase small subunit
MAGFSPKTAKQKGSRLLSRVDLRAALEARRAVLLEKVGLSVERTLREIARVAYFDPRRLFDAEGRLKAVTELDDDTAAALSSLEVEEGDVTTRKVKFFDKNAALEKAIKHLGL